jgi:hypothetical protein
MASIEPQRIELLSDAIASIFGTVLIIPMTQGLLHVQEAFIEGTSRAAREVDDLI